MDFIKNLDLQLRLNELYKKMCPSKAHEDGLGLDWAGNGLKFTSNQTT